MKNLITIYPTQSCNLRCTYCPMKKYIYSKDKIRMYPIEPFNTLPAYMILDWLKMYCNPKDTYIEYSGGEPGTYPEIDYLIKESNNLGYHGLIKTNGLLHIAETDNFRRVAAWHLDINNPPKYVDIMLIIKNQEDKWKDKIQYCLDNNIAYVVFPFQHFLRPENKKTQVIEIPKANIMIKNWAVMYAGGQLSGCYDTPNNSKVCVANMSPPPWKNIRRECNKCGNIRGFETFYTDYLTNANEVNNAWPPKIID